MGIWVSSRGSPACSHGRLSFLDVGDLGAPHCRRRFLAFRDISARLGAETITVNMHRHRTEGLEQLFGLSAVRHQPALLDVSVFSISHLAVAHDPEARRPATRSTPPRANILHTKRDELRRWSNLDVKESSTSTATWLCPFMLERRAGHWFGS
jgi:hypothetical protein